MIELSFPDGSKKQYNAGVTGLEIAAGISPQLAKAALAVKVDDDVEDLSRPIEKDAKISILTIIYRITRFVSLDIPYFFVGFYKFQNNARQNRKSVIY